MNELFLYNYSLQRFYINFTDKENKKLLDSYLLRNRINEEIIIFTSLHRLFI